MTPSEHLLRTMGAVPPDQRILVQEDPPGRHAKPLAQLGFEVHLSASEDVAPSALEDEGRLHVTGADLNALDYPDEHFSWVVMHGVAIGGAQEALVRRYAQLRNMLRSGGWLYVALPARPLNALFEADPHSTDGIHALMERTDLAVAERPVLTENNREVFVRGIFRRVDKQTAA